MKLKFLSLFVFSVFFLACNALVEPEKRLEKSWQTSELIFKTNVKDFSISRSDFNLNLTFNGDGTYEYPEASTGKTLKGTWKISSDDKVLDLIDEKKITTSFDLVEITKSKLVLGWRKIDLTKPASGVDKQVLAVYSDLIAFGGLEKAFSEAKPTSVQLHVVYVAK